jgi:hypothetical protein
MANLVKYTNGVGHLIMSIICTISGIALILIPGLDSTTKGVGVTLIMTVQGYWFVSGSAKQVASEVVSQMNQLSAAPAPAPAPTQSLAVSSVPILTMTQTAPAPPAATQ